MSDHTLPLQVASTEGEPSSPAVPLISVVAVVVGSGKGSGSQKRKPRDPNGPKPAWTAFNFFSQSEGKLVKAEKTKTGRGDFARELGERWGRVSAAGREPWKKQERADKAR